MKKLTIAAFLLTAFAAAFVAAPARAQVYVDVSIGDFYDELEPYGRWIDCSYGDCWVPDRVSRHWQPYSNGEWIWTDYGWTWLSYDPWGDDPYHYGSWVWTSRWGWAWVPGTVWAPAWVTWTYSPDYIGWAPLPPSVVFGSTGYYGRPIVLAPTQYVFVSSTRFIGSNISTVRLAPTQNTTIFRQTRPVTQFQVSDGIVRNTAISVDTVQKATRTRIAKRSIRDAKTTARPVTEFTRGGRKQVSIVAPAREIKAATSRAKGGGAVRRSESVQPKAAPRVERESRSIEREAPRVEREAPRVKVEPSRQEPKQAPAGQVDRGRPEPQIETQSRSRSERSYEARPQKSAPAPAPQAAQPAPQSSQGKGKQKQQKPSNPNAGGKKKD